MKRIVILADGTWNSPEQGRPTNVLRMAHSIRPTAAGVKQVVFYDWGVGSDRMKLAGGLTGAGIDKNIMDGYRFIVHNYDPGDALFFFGFSRGAYTVRSLAGLIRNCGILRRTFEDRIPAAYRHYRKRTADSSPDAPDSVAFRKEFAVADVTPIEFVGVWDTVGALGIPVPFWGTLGAREFLFHDTAPSRIIRHARHALSIDEDREDFLPTLWDKKPGLDLQQVWFAGVHSDVGGGYEEPGLSDIACLWMMEEASRCGLKFEPHLRSGLKPDPRAPQHNERKNIYLARKAVVRAIAGPLHRSVKIRWEADVDGYRARSKALSALLASVNGDWSRVPLVG